MKLSMFNAVADHRRRLTDLRNAKAALIGGGSFECAGWFNGDKIIYSGFIGLAETKAMIRVALDSRINDTIREIEAHGVVVDE